MKCIRTQRIQFILFIFFVFIVRDTKADEGLWLPYLLEYVNIEEMQQRGFSLTAEDIYSFNQACLTDAVVIFGSGCTGSIVSDKGLLLTNHHCGYDEIQALSSLERDYLSDGFWAESANQELPNPGLSVKFLRQVVDVTDMLLADLDSTSTLKERNLKVSSAKDSLIKQVSDTSQFVVSIKPFYYENTWLLFLYEEYIDVRLVGAPPESLGKFGGDTDNWMWPRHNPDFSLFRVYGDEEGRPADYHVDNVPIHSKYFLPISIEGFDAGDFTMMLGYPGSTYEYLNSTHLKNIAESVIEPRVDILKGKLTLLSTAMQADESIRLKYSAKYANISNVWKKYEGVLAGFKRFEVIERKKAYEYELSENINSKSNSLLFKSLREGFENVSDRQGEFLKARRLFMDAILGIETLDLWNSVRGILRQDESDFNSISEELETLANDFFKNYNKQLDEKLAAYLLTTYMKELEPQYHPWLLVEAASKKGRSINDYLEKIYKKSFLADEELFREMIPQLAEEGLECAEKDAVVRLFNAFLDLYYSLIYTNYRGLQEELDSMYTTYLPLLMKLDSTRKFYPDANFTMRLSAGTIAGYTPSDAIRYRHQTFAKGILEKNNEGIADYFLMPEIKEKLATSSSSEYSDSIGIQACFIATNHSSGGSSGSPILNNKGELIGINFDRSWESTVGDYYFDERIFRNIAVDIRFVLFVIDEIAGMEFLVEEMTILPKEFE